MASREEIVATVGAIGIVSLAHATGTYSVPPEC
jgi:hypothetical protein